MSVAVKKELDYLVQFVNDDSDQSLSMALYVHMYNSLAVQYGKIKVNRFSSKSVASRRTLELVNHRIDELEGLMLLVLRDPTTSTEKKPNAAMRLLDRIYNGGI